MTVAIAPISQAFALDLYGVLRELDPNHWRAEFEANMRERVMLLRERLNSLTDSIENASPGPALDVVRSRLSEMAQVMESHLIQPQLPERWEEFRLGMLPAYERFAVSLRHLDIHVPSLRPTNYARNIYHVANALFCVTCVRFLSEMTVFLMAAGMMTLAWSCEIGRRIIPRLNDFLMGLMGKLAHPHEAWRVNSATWYATACVILASMWNLPVASVGLVVLGFADPAAAIIGRRFGKIELVNGRTLEGTSTFIIVGTVATWIWLMVAWDSPAGLAFYAAVVGSTCGGIAELFSRRIDDNLSIPVAAALGALMIMGSAA